VPDRWVEWLVVPSRQIADPPAVEDVEGEQTRTPSAFV
jgi:hypothetical protein